VAVALLAACMIAFVFSPWWPVSVVAAAGAGFTCLVANSSTRTLLSKRAGPEHEASVMAVWAIAWAGSKPVASLTDGVLADTVGLKWTGMILALPALIPVIVMVALMVCVYVTRKRKPRPTLHDGPALRQRTSSTSGRKLTVALDRRAGATAVWVEQSSLDAFHRASELLSVSEAGRQELATDGTGPQSAILG
jgi:MFS family permease